MPAEVTAYPLNEAPLQVALWRDNFPTPAETLAADATECLLYTEVDATIAAEVLRAAIRRHQLAVLTLARCRVDADRALR